MPTMTRLPTLVTIPFSHYCELARWTLDAARVAYTEQGAMPGFHVLAVAKATAAFKPPVQQTPRAGSAWAVPLLVFEVEGQQRVLQDSHEIAKHAAARSSLYPSADRDHKLRKAIDADLLHCHDRIGPSTRRFAYYHMFQSLDAASFAELAAKNGAPAWQTALLSTPSVFARMRGYISKGLGVSKERAARSEGYITAELDALVERRLGAGAEGSTFLHGKQATLADLAFASLLAPALGTTCHAAGVWLPQPERLGAEYSEKAAAWRGHPGAQPIVELLERRNLVAVQNETETDPEAAHTTAK